MPALFEIGKDTQESELIMASGAVRVVIYILIAILPLALLSFTGSTFYPALSEIGKSSALVGFMILALQFILAGRFKWVKVSTV